MGSGFVFRLAFTNIKKNRKFYLPYVLAGVGMIMMFYIMSFLSFNQGIRDMRGADTLAAIMALGTIVIGIFAVIFLFYTNSFLIKRRKKEIGLYNILGMEKKHIAEILFTENLIISVTSIVCGLLSGILFSKLVFMILAKMVKMPFMIKFEISIKGIIITIIVFAAIYLATVLYNQMKIHLSKPIELLHGSNEGEKEPKTKALLAIIGIIALGAGYYIAITVESPLDAILLFFVAVILVIIGTYCLFVSGSIAILKALKKKKDFYYKPRHFTAVSGMIYRMKQNAVGLANICILSTMVLVMVSTTVCLYVGTEDVIATRFPGDLNISVGIHSLNSFDADKFEELIGEAANETGIKLTKISRYNSISFATSSASKDNSSFKFDAPNNVVGNTGVTTFNIVTADEYKKLTGKTASLADDEVLCYSKGHSLNDNFKIGDMKFRVKEYVDSFVSIENMDAYISDFNYLVVADNKVFNKIDKIQSDAYGEVASVPKCQIIVDFSGTDEQKMKAGCVVEDKISEESPKYLSVFYESKQESESVYYSLIGGFFFLGVFLGLVFTFAAAMIIYYKQISEGYYDKDKFEIMQKVGMSKTEVRKSVRTQVLMVFFAPLAMAGVHILAAFKMITRLLVLFSLTNVKLFAVCTLLTYIAFAVVYAIVYIVTAREYYKIIQQDV